MYTTQCRALNWWPVPVATYASATTRHNSVFPWFANEF